MRPTENTEVIIVTGTTDLRSEHGGVGRMLGIMDAIAVSVRAGERPPLDDLAQVIEFLRVFVDKCHHSKEELLLFPAIRAAGMTAVEPTIALLLEDHAAGREYVARIAGSVERLAAGDESANPELADAMVEYTQLLREHIGREERDCFHPADRELPSTVQEDLEAGYERIELEVVGGGVHESFHALLDRLSAVYRG